MISFRNGKHDLDQALDEYWLQSQITLSPYTITTYKSILGRFERWAEDNHVTLAKIDRSTIRQYLAFLAGDGLSKRSRYVHGKTVRAFLNWCEREGIVKEAVDFKGILRKPKDPKMAVPSQETVKKLIAAAEANPRDTALILLMADSGLRRKEVSLLTWPDIDFDNRRLLVRGKTGDDFAYFGMAAEDALLDYGALVAHPSRPEARVFISFRKGRKPLEPEAITAIFERLCTTASKMFGGKIKVTPHDMRRFFCTEAHRNGMSAFDLQRAMRHTNDQETKKYTNLVDDDVRRSHAKHSPMDNMLGNGAENGDAAKDPEPEEELEPV